MSLSSFCWSKSCLMMIACLLGVALHDASLGQVARGNEPLRIGVVGLDTSHSIAFTEILNDPNAAEDVAGCRVVVACPRGSADIPSSVERIPGYTAKMKELGVEIVETLPELLEKCDAVLLETNDGRPHLEQYREIAAAKKPCFIDKPLAGSLADCVAIFEVAREHGVQVFSCSSLRYATGVQKARAGGAGAVLGCEAYSPCSLEGTHPDLFWYGIHGVEILYTVMQGGCESVTRTTSDDFDVVVGRWSDGRIGSFRGIRKGASGYGGVVYGADAIQPLGGFDGYRPLVVEIVKFFKTGVNPIDPQETLELYAFMEAADESKRRGGAPVSIAETLEKARSGR